MDKTRDVDQFHDHCQIDMIGDNPSGGSSRKKSEGGTQTLTTPADGIFKIVLDTSIHSFGLLTDPLLDRVEIRTDQLDRLREGGIGLRINFLGGPSCEVFHKETFADSESIVNVRGCREERSS